MCWTRRVPDGVVNVITTTRTAEVSSAILADPRVATLSFTGSTYVGKMLLKQTAERVLPSSMELGGNAPFLVLEGADVEAAVAGAMIAKMRNGGSACTAANRFYVHDSLVEPFSAGLQEAFAGLKMGPGIDEATDLGAMVSNRERDKIVALLDEAAGEGVEIISAQQAPSTGAFVAPAVVRNVEHGSTPDAQRDLRPGGAHRGGVQHRGGRADGQRHRVRADLVCVCRRPRYRRARWPGRWSPGWCR